MRSSRRAGAAALGLAAPTPDQTRYAAAVDSDEVPAARGPSPSGSDRTAFPRTEATHQIA